MQTNMWATLPCDLLVEILRRLRITSTTVIRSAAVCRPWRRAIINNAWCLRVRPDRFLPYLLLTFVDSTWRSEDVVAMKGVGVDVGLYNTPLSSSDGFLLLAGADTAANSLCLCNPLAGSCRFLPAAAFGVSKNKCTYVVLSPGSVDSLCDGDGDGPAVQIFAVQGDYIKDGMPYQVFSSTSGSWGPVRRSRKLKCKQDNIKFEFPEPKHVVVCSDSIVCWIVIATTTDNEAWMFVFAINMRTGWAWITKLPETCVEDCFPCELVLATSGDSRQLSVVALRECRWIEVWVLVGDSWWTLRRTIDLQSLLLPICPSMEDVGLCGLCTRCGLLLPSCPSMEDVELCGFCPRSGCLFGIVRVDQDHRRYFLVGIDGSAPRLMETLDSKGGYRFPYEMDWATYISKMGYF